MRSLQSVMSPLHLPSLQISTKSPLHLSSLMIQAHLCVRLVDVSARVEKDLDDFVLAGRRGVVEARPAPILYRRARDIAVGSHPLACIFGIPPPVFHLYPACISPYPSYPAVSLYRSISSQFAAEPRYPTVASCFCSYRDVSSCICFAISRCITPYLTASKTGWPKIHSRGGLW